MSRHRLYCAGAGANMAYIMGQDMWLDPITQCHVPENEAERQRVEDAGAEIVKEAMAGVGRRCGIAVIMRMVRCHMQRDVTAGIFIQHAP